MSAARCPDCGHENIAGEELCEACHTFLSPPTPKDAVARRILKGRVSDLEPAPAPCLQADASVADAVRLMREKRKGCVLVTRGRELASIFTERDLLLRVAGLKDPERLKLSEAMKPEPRCLRHDDTVAFAFHHMAVNGFRHVPVRLADGSLGVVSSRDLLRYLCR